MAPGQLPGRAGRLLCIPTCLQRWLPQRGRRGGAAPAEVVALVAAEVPAAAWAGSAVYRLERQSSCAECAAGSAGLGIIAA
jgi:hypothetical protein